MHQKQTSAGATLHTFNFNYTTPLPARSQWPAGTKHPLRKWQYNWTDHFLWAILYVKCQCFVFFLFFLSLFHFMPIHFFKLFGVVGLCVWWDLRERALFCSRQQSLVIKGSVCRDYGDWRICQTVELLQLKELSEASPGRCGEDELCGLGEGEEDLGWQRRRTVCLDTVRDSFFIDVPPSRTNIDLKILAQILNK